MLNSKTKLKTKILEYYKTTNEQKISRTSKTHESNVPRGGKIVLWTGTEQKKKLEHITTVRNTTKMLQYFKRQSSLLSTEQPGRCVRECRYLHASWLQQRQQRSIHFPKVLPGCWVRKVGWHARKKKLPNSAHEVAIQWFFLFLLTGTHTHTQTPTKCFFLSFFSFFFWCVITCLAWA